MIHSIFIISWSYLKRRKWQSFLVGLTIALSTLLFSTTIGLLKSMDQPFDVMFEQLNASHVLLMYDYRESDSDSLRAWFETQPEVISVGKPLPYVALESAVLFEEEELDLSIQLTERHTSEQDRLFFVRGDSLSFPQIGEIWLPDHLAVSHKIEIGDTVRIPTSEGVYPLTVSATVIDPHYASSIFNPTRAWVAPGSLPFMFPVNRLTQLTLGIRLTDPAHIQTILGRFHHEKNFTGHSLEYGLFKSVFMSFYQIISLVLLIFSVLAILISLFIMRTTLSGAIRNDFKLIGLFKASGFTPANVMLIYLIQYLLLALLSLPVGIFGGYLATQAMLKLLLTSVGVGDLAFSFSEPLLITFIGFLILVGILVSLSSRKAAKVEPMEAIRSDPTTGSGFFRPFKNVWEFYHWPVSLLWGISMLFSNPRRTFYTGLSIIMAVFMVLFSVNVSHSFGKLKEQKAAWGLENSDLQVRRNAKISLPLEHQTMLDILEEDSAIISVVPYQYVSAVLPTEKENAPQDILGKAYTGDMSTIGLLNLEGVHPVLPTEVSLCVLTARELSKEVGDSVNLFIEGQHQQFSISGIYQDVSNLGKGFRISEAAISNLDPLFKPEFYALKLRDDIAPQEYEQDLQARLGETIIIEQSIDKRAGIRNTIASMQGAMTLIAVFFLLILFAILFNDTLMSVRDYRRSLGVMKTIGMTKSQLRLAQVHKFLLMGITCLAIGGPTGMVLSPLLISQMTQGLGLTQFPFLTNWVGTLLVIPGMLAFVGLSAWLASGKMVRKSPHELILEF